MKPTIGITLGDYNGIGPEVTLKAICSSHVRRMCSPVLIGSIDVYEYYARVMRSRVQLKEINDLPLVCSKGEVPVIQVKKLHHPQVEPGKHSKDAGTQAGAAIEEGATFCLKHFIDGIVTAPVSKESMHAAGFPYPGQTEMLAGITHSKRVMMLLVAGTMRVGLATVHTPLHNVSNSLTKRTIREKLSILHESLQRDFALKAPKIAVLGLNPHAGENGLIGHEERSRIQPSIHQSRQTGIHVDGPFPA
ncbi:MAG: 4-hydroxythreonine-4-phosphate dehydrogenase PdxA, partial [Ignavibacteriales bacterium]|nr:4-hydroxythreonine-4-phosphate dehydrogenase PdxA [Ignavibacteriales bacterium]